MKILLVNYEYPPIGGGGGNATREIARALVRRGNAVTVLTTLFQQQPTEEMLEGIRMVRLRAPRLRADRCSVYEMTRFMIAAWRQGPCKVSETKPDAVIGFFAVPSGPPALRIARSFGVPCIISLRGGDVPGFYPEMSLLHSLAAPILQWVWRRADLLVGNSKGLCEAADRYVTGIRTHLIPNGVDAERFSGERNYQRESLRLLTVGRLSTDKGFPEGILCTLQALLSIEGNWQLSIAGDGPKRSDLELAVEQMNLSQRVEFLGWLRKEHIPQLYRDCDVLVHPTKSEGCPNVVLEAMASGLPIVACQAAGTEDLICHEQNGLLVPYGDANAMRKTLQSIMNDGMLRSRLGMAACQAAQEMSWDSVARQYEELALKLVNR